MKRKPWPRELELLWSKEKCELRESWLCDRCWVCNENIGLSSSDRKRNDHHIIPVAYGGAEGPQVSLCSAHHSLLHEVALSFISGRKNSSLQALQGLSPIASYKVTWLASRVYLAHEVFSKDVRRRIKVTLHFSAESLQELDAARRSLNQSRERFINNAIRHYASSQFPLKK